MSWLQKNDLKRMAYCGTNVKISDKALIYGIENLSIGDNVRIDAQTLILAKNGQLNIGSFVHIAAQNMFLCAGKIFIGNHVAISFGNQLISASDDFSGDHLIGPVYTEKQRQVVRAPIVMKDFSAIGAGSIVMPGVVFAEGAVLGAGSLAPNNLKADWSIYYGRPAVYQKARSRACLDLVHPDQ
jgi:galactoside O-acetyltransferase